MSYLDFGKNPDFSSNKLVSEMIIYRTYYYSKKVEKVKEIISYNFHNNLTIRNRYDDKNILQQRLSRVYDSTGTVNLFRKLETWHPIIGHFYDTYFYQYDSNGFLSGIVEKDENNNINRKTTIINNEKGHPIELSIYIGNEMQGRETAEYDYEKNEVFIQYFNKQGAFFNSATSKIESSISEPTDVLNEYGDIIKSAKYEKTIKYDKFGNWIKEVYSVLKSGKFVKSSETTRVIKYRK